MNTARRLKAPARVNASLSWRICCACFPEYIYLEGRLDEDFYDSVRRGVENLLGPDDTYLEVFEEDMKYSDTPIAASVSEGLADIFQVMYNLLDAIRDMPEEVVLSALVAVKDDFEAYWSRVLCNVLRALNHIRYTSTTADE